LYRANLTEISTQAALIAGFSFTALIETADSIDFADENRPLKKIVLPYVFYACFATSFSTALYVLALGTVVVMFGPTLALKGSTDDAVKYAATHMRKLQMKILKAAFTAITTLLLGACILSFQLYDIGIAVLTFVVYVGVYFYLVSYGFNIYRTFVPLDGEAFLEPDAIGYHPDGKKMTAKEHREDIEAKQKQRLTEALEASKLKVKGSLWKRQPIEDGGLFVKYYAVLEKGRLDFYAKEKVIS
jgi:hypothetical protein